MEPSQKLPDLSSYIIEGPFFTNKKLPDISWELMKGNKQYAGLELGIPIKDF